MARGVPMLMDSSSRAGTCQHLIPVKASIRTRLTLGTFLAVTAAIFITLHAAGLVSTKRLYGVLGSLLGLVPGSLHLRRSKRHAPPRNLWRWCSAMTIASVGSLHVLPWLPFIEWHDFVGTRDIMDSRSWLPLVDSLACFGVTCIASICVLLRHPPSTYVRHAVWAICGIWWIVVSLTAVSMVSAEFQPILQHFAWHLEGTIFKWTAWLMVGRIKALDRKFTLCITHPNRMVDISTVCFHLRVALETLFDGADGVPDASLAGQLAFALVFLCIWMALCLQIIACLGQSLHIVQKEARKVTGAPQAEAVWASKVLKLELAACLCLTFTCTTLWWIPYKILVWKVGSEQAERTFVVPVVIAHRFNMLIKAASAAVLSGLLWHQEAPQPAPCDNLYIQTEGPQSYDWARKVDELAHRAISLESLLSFWKELPKVMPSFDPLRTTTNDVVHMAIIPLSRTEDGLGGQALASVWSGGQRLRAKCMVTHNWSMLFLHLVAGIIADALNETYYDAVAAKLLSTTGIEELTAALQRGQKTAYWVCAFSINQHACICGGFEEFPTEDPDEFAQRQERNRDTVSGVPYPVCGCREPKFLNDQPEQCEVNKFNSMMRHLAADNNLSHLVVTGPDFMVFTRAWCIAEIVESEVSQIPKRIMMHSEWSLDNHYQSLSCIDVNDCHASRPQDRKMILDGISDLEAFNAQLQWAIFGTSGLLSKWVDGPGRAAVVARILRRIEGRPVLSSV